jgi:polyisoprenoid-binding protein YceI
MKEPAMSSDRFLPRFVFGVLALTSAAVASLVAGDAEARLLKTGNPSVQFTAVGPAGMKIVGTTSDLTIADGADSISIAVPLANLTTGIALRDRHMRDKYLEVQTYPLATLKVDRNSLQFPGIGGETSGDVQGMMAIHGQSHAVTFHYVAKRDGSGFAT